MTPTSICYGYFSECPKKCDMDEPKKNQEKCFVYRTCYHDWRTSGKRTGLKELCQIKI